MDELISKEIENLEKKFNNLNNLEEGEKPYYNEDIIEISKRGVFQSLSRFVSLNDRHVFLKKFKEDIDRINKLYDSIILNLNIFIFAFVRNYFENIKSMQKLYILILKSINILKETYKSDEKYIEELENLKEYVKSYYKENIGLLK